MKRQMVVCLSATLALFGASAGALAAVPAMATSTVTETVNVSQQSAAAPQSDVCAANGVMAAHYHSSGYITSFSYSENATCTEDTEIALQAYIQYCPPTSNCSLNSSWINERSTGLVELYGTTATTPTAIYSGPDWGYWREMMWYSFDGVEGSKVGNVFYVEPLA